MNTKSQDIRWFPIIFAVVTFVLIITGVIVSHFVGKMLKGDKESGGNGKEKVKIAKVEKAATRPVKGN